MRKLLNTLFVLSPESFLTLDGENIVIKQGQTEVHRQALHTLESICCFTYKGATPALMGACAARGIDLCFSARRGNFLRGPWAKNTEMSCCAESNI